MSSNCLFFTLRNLWIIKAVIGKPDAFLNWDAVSALVKEVLPDRCQFIEESGPQGLTLLLGEMKSRLLSEIQEALVAENEDGEAVANAAKILDLAAKVQNPEPVKSV